MFDYVEKGNRIRFEYILLWNKRYVNEPNQRANLNLIRLIYEVYQLYTKAPPLPLEEIDNFFYKKKIALGAIIKGSKT